MAYPLSSTGTICHGFPLEVTFYERTLPAIVTRIHSHIHVSEHGVTRDLHVIIRAPRPVTEKKNPAPT